MDFQTTSANCSQRLGNGLEEDDMNEPNLSMIEHHYDNSIFKTPRTPAAIGKPNDSYNEWVLFNHYGFTNASPSSNVNVPSTLSGVFDPNDTSWTSSLATPTPVTRSYDVSYSNLNSDEKKVLLPCNNEEKLIPRTLFDSEDDQSFNTSKIASPHKEDLEIKDACFIQIQSTPKENSRIVPSNSLPVLSQQFSPILGVKQHEVDKTPSSSSAKTRQERQRVCKNPASPKTCEKSSVDIIESSQSDVFKRRKRTSKHRKRSKRDSIALSGTEQTLSSSPSSSKSNSRSDKSGVHSSSKSTGTVLDSNSISQINYLDSSPILGQPPLRRRKKPQDLLPKPVQETPTLNNVSSTDHTLMEEIPLQDHLSSPILGRTRLQSKKTKQSGRLKSSKKGAVRNHLNCTEESFPINSGTSQNLSPIIGRSSKTKKKNGMEENSKMIFTSLLHSEIENSQTKTGTSPILGSSRFICKSPKHDLQDLFLATPSTVCSQVFLPISGGRKNVDNVRSCKKRDRLVSSQDFASPVPEWLSSSLLPLLNDQHADHLPTSRVDSVSPILGSKRKHNETHRKKTKGRQLEFCESLSTSRNKTERIISIPSLAEIIPEINNSTHTVPQSIQPIPETSIKCQSKQPSATTSSANRSFVFTQDQQDLSFNTIHEVCNASELIASLKCDEFASSSPQKLKFVNSVKDEPKLTTDVNTNCKPQVDVIKQKVGSSVNFIYPISNNNGNKTSLCSNLDLKDITKYASLLETVDTLGPNNASPVPNCSVGFVQFSKLSEEQTKVENTTPLQRPRSRNKMSLARRLGSVSVAARQKQFVKVSTRNDNHIDAHRNREMKSNTYSCTQITNLVKDAELMFLSDDSQWDNKPMPAMEKISDTLNTDHQNSLFSDETLHPMTSAHRYTPPLATEEHPQEGEQEEKDVDGTEKTPASTCKLLGHLSNSSENLMSLVDISSRTPNAKLPFPGFALVSGKKINLSETSLKKAKMLHSDILDSPLENVHCSTPISNLPLPGFTSASGKKCIVSEKSLINAKQILHFGEDSPLSKPDFDTPKANIPLQGFTSASGKKCSVSEKSLNNAKQLLRFAEDSPSSKVDFDTPKANIPLQGFASASGKKCSVSEKSLNNAKQLLRFAEDSPPSKVDLDTPKANIPLQGFASASGKKCSVSEKSLNNAKQLLRFAEDSPPSKVDLDTPKANIPLQGFASASGKKCSVSEKSLNNAKQLLRFAEDSPPSKVDLDTPKGNIPLHGFASASGKKCSVSEKSLNNAKQLIRFAEDSPLSKLDFDTPKANIPLHGFASASGKKCSVSEKSLNNAKQLLRFAEDSPLSKVDLDTPKANIPLQGFASASGKKCSVSEKSLNNAKQLLHFVEDPLITGANYDTPKSNIPLQRASSKKFSVSENSLKRVRTLFSEGEECSNLHKPSFTSDLLSNKTESIKKPKISFMSASGRKPDAVSESALNEARSIFHESQTPNALKQTPSPKGKSVREQELDTMFSPCTQDAMAITEVLEVTEIMLAAEVSGIPEWLHIYTSSPSQMQDRQDFCQPMLDGPQERKSPILGCHDKFYNMKKKKSVAKKEHTVESKENAPVFKIPYKQRDVNTLPTVNIINKKRLADFEFGTPFAKRPSSEVLKPMEAAMRAELSVDEVGRLRVEAFERQLLSITTKDRSLCQQSVGSLLSRKHQERTMSWRCVSHGSRPGAYSRAQLKKFGLREAVINVNAANAADFKFYARDHYGPNLCRYNTDGLSMSDAAVLILEPDGHAGVDRVEAAFLASPGVDPVLVPARWVRNHFRWVVTKLAATERSFPQCFAARCLTANNVLLQLKYRYDREIDRSECPALRRIFEKDDSAGRRLVLVVARIIKTQALAFELELSDGWYSIVASLDGDLSRLVGKSVIDVGTKLITHGAEVVNHKDASYPLEASSDVRLKLNANATRRARWDTHLGYQANPGPMQLRLGSLLPSGGTAGRVDVYVARVYPVVYVEVLADGKRVTRSGAAENCAAAQHERRRQEQLEALYARIGAELDTEHESSCGLQLPTNQRLEDVTSGSQLCRMLEKSAEPGSLQALLSADQLEEVMQYRQQREEARRRELESRMQQELGEQGGKRKVSSLLKIRCVDPKCPSGPSAVLSVWRAPEDLGAVMREGSTVAVFNMAASGARGGTLQLTAGRQTRYQILSPPHPETDSLLRTVTSLSLPSAGDFKPLFGELDVVGLVVHIGPGINNFETIYLADQHSAILGVAFWGGIKEFGFEDILKSGAVIGATNLQWRHTPVVQRIPSAYATDQSTFSRHPRQPHLQEAFQSLQSLELDDYVRTAREKVLRFLEDMQSGVKTTLHQPPRPSSYPPSVPHHPSASASSTLAHQPPTAGSYLPSVPHHSSVSACSTVIPSTQHRLEQLSRYCEPPPLPPMSICSSRNIGEFRMPAQLPMSEQDVNSPPLSLG